MDQLSGFHVCQELTDNLNKENEDIWRKPFVMLTAKPKSRERQYATSLGVKDYMALDTPQAEFIARIMKVLE